MSFIKFWERLRGKASSKEDPLPGRDPALARIKSGWLFDPNANQFDLLTVLTYLSCIASANVTREQLFEAAANLNYGPSPYFAQVANLVSSLGHDFTSACQVVAGTAEDEVMRHFLLRFGNSLASGEPEAVFLERETHVQMEDYTNEYERDLESLRKWTDAFVALMVSVNLVVLVSLISNMIYALGSLLIVTVEVVAIASAGMGAWLIYRIAPFDPVVHKLRDKCPEQKLMSLLARILFPAALLTALLAYVVFQSIGLALVLAGILILPVGVVTHLLERKVDARDRDIADFLRSLGGVTAARGSTVIASLDHIDRRSIGSLEPELKRLLVRVAVGVETSRAWLRFIAETGSELVHRVVRCFWDAVNLGGDPDTAGRLSADMALKVSLLRAKRKLVSSTFNYVVVPLHIALAGTLVFMTDVVSAFNTKLVEAQSTVGNQQTTSITPEQIGIPNALTFQQFDTAFIKFMVLAVIIALTVVNAFAPRAAAGGHSFKLALFGAFTLCATGAVLLLVPPLANSMFSNAMSQPLS
jgi:archaeal flagellar protein FlaJ